jgi:hypothetical protein
MCVQYDAVGHVNFENINERECCGRAVLVVREHLKKSTIGFRALTGSGNLRPSVLASQACATDDDIDCQLPGL